MPTQLSVLELQIRCEQKLLFIDFKRNVNSTFESLDSSVGAREGEVTISVNLH